MSLSKADRLAKRISEQGRHIFLYNHIWTGQTVYSLDRVLNNAAAISQLPFAGKQTVPRALRKDIWRPLASVSFPNAPQGLQAYRKLREYRKLQELSWAKPTIVNGGLLDLENPYRKQETVRPSPKNRSRLIMDQRANSIADLAAVLREQEAIGLAKERVDAAKRQGEETRAREELVTLAEEERNGGMPVLKEAIEAQEAAIADLKARHAAGGEDAPTRKDIYRQTASLSQLRLKLRKMKAAKDAFESGHARLTKHAESQSRSGQLQRGASELQLDIEIPSIFYLTRPVGSATVPKRGSTKQELARKQVPNYSADGIVIKWTNPLDAEYAESWPAAIEHQDAGLLRHTAPKPEEEAIFEVEQILRSPKALQELSLEEQRQLDDMEGRSDLGPQDFMQETRP
ncbi:transcriptional regulation of mitochondrial recombination-domain-containing protein [Delphinella strobiligena]|nr:transcriptional regulation of mitochondrial recombination-domain-containing protein [Delphinella strobiligena]